MTFCTAINCMDGRAQLPIIHYMKKRFNCQFVDNITAAGVNALLAKGEQNSQLDWIFNHLDISLNNHHSNAVAVSGHYDCAANPAPKEKQIKQIKQARQRIAEKYPNITVIGLWVGQDWQVLEVA